MLRGHEVFQSPRPIDVKKTVTVPVPDAWKDTLSGHTIKVIPLAREAKQSRTPGWCTYTYEHAQAPELEVICGGINSKTPKAGAVWRQGNLLHFGFDLAPADMNETGQSLLVNCVAYAARFTDDRPVVRTPSVFAGGQRLFDRDVVARLMARKGDLKLLDYYLSKEAYEELKGKDRGQVAAWFKHSRDFLHAAADGGLAVDRDAQKFGVAPASEGFFGKAVAALGKGDQSASARRLLARYAPDGPGEDAPADQWKGWWTANRPYLFFSDTGGYRWLTDPLAKSRGVPTAKLHGPARATRPPVQGGE